MTNKNIKIRFNRRKLTNFDNFNHGTKAMFEEIEVSPYLDIGDIKFEELKEIYKLSSTAYQMIRNAHRGGEVIERFSDKPFIDKWPDVISDSGSCYWFVENNGKPVVYKGSDH